jgi:hypothetical protein
MRRVSLSVCGLFAVVAVLAVVAGAQPEPLLVPWAESARFQFLADVRDTDALAAIMDGGLLLELPVYQISLLLTSETMFGGREQILYKNRSPIALEAIAFQLLPNMLGGEMVVSDVRVNGEEAEFDLDKSDSSVGWLRLPELVAPGATVFIELSFDVRVPLWGDHVDTRFNYASGILKAAYSFPLIAFHIGCEWDVRRPPLLGESSWREHALFAVEIDTLSEFEIVCSGREVSRVTAYDRTRRMYVAGPANDFFWGGSFRFVVTEERAGDVLLRCHAPSSVQRDASAALYYAKEAILVFSSHLSPYPFAELDIAFAGLSDSLFGGIAGAEFSGVFLLDWGVGGGQDNLGLEPFDHNVDLEAVVVHEVAHEWFAAIVASDPIAEPWLDESLAQLATWLYFTNRYSGFGYAGFEGGLLYRLESAGLSLDNPTPLNVSVEDVDPALYQGMIYVVGPLVLRDVVLAGCLASISEIPDWVPFAEGCGWPLLHAYVDRFSWGTANTEDFADLVQTALGSEAWEILSRWLSP